MPLAAQFIQYQHRFEEALARYLPQANNTSSEQLHEAMRYAALGVHLLSFNKIYIYKVVIYRVF